MHKYEICKYWFDLTRPTVVNVTIVMYDYEFDFTQSGLHHLLLFLK